MVQNYKDLSRLLLIFFIPLLISCKSSHSGFVADMDYPFRTTSRFEIHQNEFDPIDVFNPMVEKVFSTDMKSFLLTLIHEMEYLNLRIIDAHRHDVVTVYGYHINPGTPEPDYKSDKIKYPKLSELPAGAWVMDMVDEERKLLVFRGWCQPDAKANDPALEIRKCAQKIVSHIPYRK